MISVLRIEQHDVDRIMINIFIIIPRHDVYKFMHIQFSAEFLARKISFKRKHINLIYS